MLKVILFLFCVTSAIARQQSRGYHYPVPRFRLKSPSQSCRLGNNGQNGVCQRFSSCPSAQNSFYKSRVTPTYCQYNSADPIVCCPVPASNVPVIQAAALPPRSSALRRGSASKRQCDQTYTDGTVHTAVVGGEDAADFEFPYMSAIGWRKASGSGYDYLCGGSLIAPKFILSAAHCTSVNGAAPVVARTGGGNLGDPKGSANLDVPIARIIVHPGYKRREVYNDIALFELRSSSLGFGRNPACLWTSANINTAQATAIGYGNTQFGGTGTKQLQKVVLNVFSNQECSKFYPPAFRLSRGIIDSQLCVGDPNKKKDTCQGDSGGPVIHRTNRNTREIPYVIGVTSFGQGCAGGPPSIYTRVSSYIDWIESIVWPSG